MGTHRTSSAAIVRWAMAGVTALVAAAAIGLAASPAAAQTRLQAGVLACSGEGGWGLIITSRKTFNCTFSGDDSGLRGQYTAVIRRVGLDLGKTGNTSLVWLVFGPADMVGDNFIAGSLEGTYVGVGAEAAVGVGLGANALIGGGADSFALQPVSVQVQTGLSVAAGVQRLDLDYVGPLE